MYLLISWLLHVVVVLTQETVNIKELGQMCGKFSSHVQVIYGTPIDVISFYILLYLL